jgi:hypothetical protein
LDKPARVAFKAIGRALARAFAIRDAEKVAVPPLSKKWLDPTDRIEAKSFNEALHVWVLLLSDVLLADESDPEYIKFALPFSLTPWDPDKAYLTLNSLIDLPLGEELGEGGFGNVRWFVTYRQKKKKKKTVCLQSNLLFFDDITVLVRITPSSVFNQSVGIQLPYQER